MRGDVFQKHTLLEGYYGNAGKDTGGHQISAKYYGEKAGAQYVRLGPPVQQKNSPSRMPRKSHKKKGVDLFQKPTLIPNDRIFGNVPMATNGNPHLIK
jgi:hypothetical protein